MNTFASSSVCYSASWSKQYNKILINFNFVPPLYNGAQELFSTTDSLSRCQIPYQVQCLHGTIEDLQSQAKTIATLWMPGTEESELGQEV